MGLSKNREKGFTLVEILIVLLLLSALTSVVIMSISGVFSRGTKEAWTTDREIIRNSVHLFLYDIHIYDSTNGWNDVTGVGGHYYPTANGRPFSSTLTDLLGAANSDADPHNYFNNGRNGAIWMSLLVNSPGSADMANPETPDGSSPINGENGPYLNELPQSSSNANGNNSGTYTWVIFRDGVVNAVYWNGSEWKANFSGSYP
ncbi:prepilin-type N-terminal cleavage/methylation domain-containing protein [Chloroflexota bacterium]